LGCLHIGDPRAVQDFPGYTNPRMMAKCAHRADMGMRRAALFISVKVVKAG
jgi:hypothetical protein